MSDKKHHLPNPLRNVHLPWKQQEATEKTPLLQAAMEPKTKKKKISHDAENPSASRTWDVKMPPSKMKMVNGMLVPTMEGTLGGLVIKRRRRISVEIHSELASDSPPPDSLLQEDTKVDDSSVGLSPGDTVEVRVLKPVSNKVGSDGKIEGSDRGLHAADDASEVWVTDYVFGLDNAKIIKIKGSLIEARLGHGDETQIRHIHFSSDKEANSFHKVMLNIREMEDKLKDQQLKKFRDLHPSLAKGTHKQIRLLIEIVSATNLPDSDGETPNPYVVVSLGASNEIHRTEPIRNTNNPIWTINTGSHFLLDVTPEEFFGSAQGLSFHVGNYDPIATDNTLGKVYVTQETLLNGNGSRIEYTLEVVAGNQANAVTHGYKKIRQDGAHIISGAGKHIRGLVTGDERLHPVNDVRKAIGGDSDDEIDEGTESGLDKIALEPARVAKKLLHTKDSVAGDDNNDDDDKAKEDDGLLLTKGPLHWLRGAKGMDTHPGKLVLRFRQATNDDIEFMKRLVLDQEKGISGIYANETFVNPRASHEKPHREHRTVDKEKQYRIKPYPDPDRPEEETMWMTSAELDTESLKPSTKWVEAGSGELGKLFVEVISCSGLPNMDYQETGTGKTDAFACLVYEDAIVNTEVISNTLNPRWMPWTQRAFIFNIMHPSSDLMVGVLDYDSPAPLAMHDRIGRTEIDVTNMRPGTEYIVYYDLYASSLVKKRNPKGSIQLRVRLELCNERKALVAALTPPPQIYVNVATYRDYRVANFVIEGKYDTHEFDMNLFAEYVEALKEDGFALLPILKNAAYSIVFWRGHCPLRLRVFRYPPLPASDESDSLWNRFTKNVTVLLPLNSVVAFIGGILLVENYNLLPSFVLFAIAWLFLATSGNSNHNPSPWRHRRSFPELTGVLVSNKSPVVKIEPNQNEAAIQAFMAEKAEAQQKIKQEAKEELEEEAKAHDAVGYADEYDEKVEMRTKIRKLGDGEIGNVSMNPLKYILYPMQQNLALVCKWFYVARSFLMWEECYYCYWIVIGCITGGLAILFVPWGWLVRWALRMCVWIFLGPWMKLYDLYYSSKNQTTEEARKAAEARVRDKYETLLVSTTLVQTQREDLVKLKDMKTYLFGKYLAVLPRFKQQRYLDFPLISSYTSPCFDKDANYDITCRVYGQQLTGEMIPKREIDRQKHSS